MLPILLLLACALLYLRVGLAWGLDHPSERTVGQSVCRAPWLCLQPAGCGVQSFQRACVVSLMFCFLCVCLHCGLWYEF